jgi:hypothetical protein
MFSKRFKALTVVFMTMAVAIPEFSVPAAPFVPTQIGAVGSSVPNLDNSNLFTEVRHSSGQRYRGNRYIYPRRGYSRGRNYGGNRYSYRRHGYNSYYRGHRYYRHGGRYYGNYGWPYYGLGLGFGLGYGGGYDYYDDGYYGGGSHVQWCLNRYRSYDPRTNTYMGYDGYRHRCNSPY